MTNTPAPELVEKTRFRKKPVVIDAVRVNAADFNGHDWDGFPFDANPQWLLEAIERGEVVPVTPGCTDYAEWEIRTLEDGSDGRAKHIASPGDWIIRGVKGELYPCKPDIFEATYEPALSAIPPTPEISEDEADEHTGCTLPELLERIEDDARLIKVADDLTRLENICAASKSCVTPEGPAKKAVVHAFMQSSINSAAFCALALRQLRPALQQSTRAPDRNGVLEEAARVAAERYECQTGWHPYYRQAGETIAHAIRALKSAPAEQASDKLEGDCPECNGTGTAEHIGGYARPCDACHGEGTINAGRATTASETMRGPSWEALWALVKAADQAATWIKQVRAIAKTELTQSSLPEERGVSPGNRGLSQMRALRAAIRKATAALQSPPEQPREGV